MEIPLSSMYSRGSEADVLKIMKDSLVESGSKFDLVGMKINPNLTLGLTLKHNGVDEFDIQKAVKTITKNTLMLNVLLNLRKVEYIDSNSLYLSFNFKAIHT